MKTISDKEIRLLFEQCLHAPFVPSDKTYACPTSEWVTKHFYNWLKLVQVKLGVSKWQRTNDCDNFSARFAAFAPICHSLTIADQPDAPEGIAVGEFWYHRRDSGGGHAINFAITVDEGLIFIEPQNGSVLKLFDTEMRSCFLIKL